MTSTSRQKPAKLTPLMQQFYAIKEKHPDKILFFRMGDFYEMFGDDAIKAAPILGITLTSRSQGGPNPVALAGVPHHSADKYLARLVKHGEKVVIVEQVEDPKTAKGLVKRDVVEILTPGTATIDTPEMESQSISLAAIFPGENGHLGMSILDLATGVFTVDQGEADKVAERLKVLDPSEIIYPSEHDEKLLVERLALLNGDSRLTAFDDWNFDQLTADRELNDHFGTKTLDGFGLTRCQLGITAAGAIFRYLKENHRSQLDHIRQISRFDSGEYMTLDYSSVRNLELVTNIATATEQNSLLEAINLCHTNAGSRRLKNALLHPFRNKVSIERRLTGVAELIKNRDLCFELRSLTKGLGDLERLAGRLGIGRLNPRQMAGIASVLKTASVIGESLKNAHSPHLSTIGHSVPDGSAIITKIETALVDEPPMVSSKGGIIKRGYSIPLDDLNDSIKDARLYIGSLQKKERERTGLPTLKVGFNKVFGYYIEISKVASKDAPPEYIRKQTLVNAERYITPELKEKEELILSAEEKIFALELDLYNEVVEYLGQCIADIIATAHLLAEIDLVSGLADLAVERGYCRPEIYEDSRLLIERGRHPVIESVLPSGSYVANDINFTDSDDRIHILTGPNMSGKSTYLRQIGLIVIMAQIGSFVPADSAQIGLVDRVFTRVGALDNLARGQSTFLVEMVETANIMHNATVKSLVLLDEVGRGTSTFDGLSIAWAVVEHIEEKLKCRTLFATHYHELTSMAFLHSSVHNYQVAVKKWEDKIIFMHQIVPGGCDDSYGIEAAKLAGLPRSAISRAKQILKLLESGKFNQSELGKGIYVEKVQTSLFDSTPSETELAIKELDVDNMTPIDALNLLRKMKDDLS